jgi:hypothetical protein
VIAANRLMINTLPTSNINIDLREDGQLAAAKSIRIPKQRRKAGCLLSASTFSVL